MHVHLLANALAYTLYSLIRPSPWLVCSVLSDDERSVFKIWFCCKVDKCGLDLYLPFLAVGYICVFYTAVTSEHRYGHTAIYLEDLARFVKKDFGDTTLFFVFVEKTWSNPLSSGMEGLTNSSCAGNGRRWSRPSTLRETAGHRAHDDQLRPCGLDYTRENNWGGKKTV